MGFLKPEREMPSVCGKPLSTGGRCPGTHVAWSYLMSGERTWLCYVCGCKREAPPDEEPEMATNTTRCDALEF
jgi:hypothetical protein